MDELESLEDIRLFDESRPLDESSIHVDDAFKKIEATCKSKK